MIEDSNLLQTNAKENIREMFALTFELYKVAEKNKNLYRIDPDGTIPQKLIELYYKEIKPDYNSLIYSFKRKYIPNEALVEKNDTKEERQGISLVYDYIQNFNPDKDYFNIFVTGLELHRLLYKPLDDKNNRDYAIEYLETQSLIEQAKANKDINMYKEAKKKLESLNNSICKFGGKLRDDDNNVALLGVDIDVVSAAEAKRIYNEYLSDEKKIEYENMLASKNIFLYINYCVKTIANLIKIQPFNDGNKRTCRSLLNLMFKNKNLPPVYITKNERAAYKDALIKAIKDDDYNDVYNLYCYKICDSIYELDIVPYLQSQNKKESKR